MKENTFTVKRSYKNKVSIKETLREIIYIHLQEDAIESEHNKLPAGEEHGE